MINDSTHLNELQQIVHNTVKTKFMECLLRPKHDAFTDLQIGRAINELCKIESPGIDGITAEQLIYGNCESLRSQLRHTYNAMFEQIFVPSFLQTGIIIPKLKKTTLDPNIPNNHRPTTLGSTHGKLLEFLMLPRYTSRSNRFACRDGRGTLWPVHSSMICCNIANLRDLQC